VGWLSTTSSWMTQTLDILSLVKYRWPYLLADFYAKKWIESCILQKSSCRWVFCCPFASAGIGIFAQSIPSRAWSDIGGMQI
jgi:hypothetical protein